MNLFVKIKNILFEVLDIYFSVLKLIFSCLKFLFLYSLFQIKKLHYSSLSFILLIRKTFKIKITQSSKLIKSKKRDFVKILLKSPSQLPSKVLQKAEPVKVNKPARSISVKFNGFSNKFLKYPLLRFKKLNFNFRSSYIKKTYVTNRKKVISLKTRANKTYKLFSKKINLYFLGTYHFLTKGARRLVKKINKFRVVKPKRAKSKKIKKVITKKGFRLWFIIKASVYFLFIFLTLLAGTLFYFQIIYSLPNPDNVVVDTKRLTSYVYDKNGELMYKNYKDANRTLVSVNDLPDNLKNAIISVEDDQFYYHYGISLKAIARASLANYRKQDVVQGGSTITQQLVKNTLLGSEKTFERKTKEAILSVLVDHKFSKNEILEMYLNTVSFGGTSYGVQEAAQMFFQKDAKDLTLAESALLAGLPTAPSDNSPYADIEQSKKRQELVLTSMVKNGYITNFEAREALKQELNIKYPITQIRYAHFVFYVQDYIKNKYGEYLFDNGGLRIYTSLDPEIQDMAQQVVTLEVEKIKGLRISNGSALITKNKTGEVSAMVGSKDFYSKDIDGFVNLTTSLRQPGSSIKPFNYSLGIQNGLTAGTVIQDTPVTYSTPGSPPYKPVNYDGKFRGPVTVRRALANSLNIPAVKTLEKNGVQNFINYAKLFGFNHWNRNYYGLSLALGAAEVTMLELNQGFSVFANDGALVKVNPILYITNNSGDIVEYNPCVYSEADFPGKQILTKPAECEQSIIAPSNAFIIKSILSDFNARREAFGVSILNVPGTGVKTGTTNDLKDNWAVGFNSEYTVGSWVGNNDSTPMSYVASGITGASPIWANIIKQITSDSNKLILNPPSDIYVANICPLTGQLACRSCGGITEFYITGTQPKVYCSDENIKTMQDKEKDKKDSGKESE